MACVATVLDLPAEVKSISVITPPAVTDRIVREAILKGIEGACRELIDGKLHDQFRLDVFQGGAGTSTNMNANEVIANRALELMGHRKGEYEHCSPHDHVNCSQSTNDAYPTAIKLGVWFTLRDTVSALRELNGATFVDWAPKPAYVAIAEALHAAPPRS